MAKKTEYTVKGVPTKITATSRCAIKVQDNYYTIEVSEERSLNDDDIVMEKEWSDLFDEVNAVVDAQCEDIISTFTKKR